MRELLRVTFAAFAVLVVYFGYIYWSWPQVYGAQHRDARVLLERLEKYREAKGAYPILPSFEGPVAELKKVLADSGVSFPALAKLGSLDEQARYVSVTGKSFGLQYRFNRFGEPVTCMVEVGITKSGWWGQPPPCPLLGSKSGNAIAGPDWHQSSLNHVLALLTGSSPPTITRAQSRRHAIGSCSHDLE